VSTPSIAPYLPSGRVCCTGQSFRGSNEVTLELAPNQRYAPVCSSCGEATRRVHSSYTREVRDLGLGSHRVTLRLRSRRLRCGRCRKISSEHYDFVDLSARVTKRLARMVADLCKRLPISDVAELLGLDWKLVKRCDQTVLQEEFSETRTAGLRLLAIDEIAIKKGGQKYLTIVLDYETGRVVWVGEGHTHETLSIFFAQMSTQERAAIEAVAIDMWDPFEKAIRKHLPRARIVYDLFHVVAAYHRQVLDEVRIRAYRTVTSSDERRFIKGSRFLLYRNAENLQPEQKPRLEELLRVNKEIATAYMLRDSLKQIWATRTPWQARAALRTWCRLAIESQIPALIKFARMLRRRERGIVTRAAYPINTSRLEGVNNKIKAIKRRSYGFHDPQYFALKVKQAFPG
jgi:transposase